VKWLQIHITVDQAQVDFTETLLMSLGAVSVTLDDAEDQALLEPPGETPLWNKVIVTGIYQQDDQDPIDVETRSFSKEQLPDAPIRVMNNLKIKSGNAHGWIIMNQFKLQKILDRT
jgi:ribosomal protein L11 methyltransferase